MELKSFRMVPPLLLIALALIPGASGDDFNVTYSQLKICALNRSTVTMNATYACAQNLTVKKIYWIVNPVYGIESPDLRNMSNYTGRVWYSSDNQQYLALTISNVTQSDENIYYIRIFTNDTHKRFLAMPGPRIKVTDLYVTAPAEVTEGQTAVLKCSTSCNLTNSAFVWFKDGCNVASKIINGNELHLQNVSSEDAGSYCCAVRGYDFLPSPALTLSVLYSPKNVVVSISPSEIKINSSVSLTCHSDANPPVTNYTWFKEGETSPVGFGQNYSIINFTTEDIGLYLCQAQNQLGALNGTAFVTLTDYSHGHPVFLYIGVGVGVCVVASLLGTVFWLRRSKKKKENMEEMIYQNVGPNVKDDVKRAPDSSTPPNNVYTNQAHSRIKMNKNKPRF